MDEAQENEIYLQDDIRQKCLQITWTNRIDDGQLYIVQLVVEGFGVVVKRRRRKKITDCFPLQINTL